MTVVSVLGVAALLLALALLGLVVVDVFVLLYANVGRHLRVRS